MLKHKCTKQYDQLFIVLSCMFIFSHSAVNAKAQSSSESSSPRWVVDKIITIAGPVNTTVRYIYDEAGNKIQSERTAIVPGFKTECTTLISNDSNGFMTKSMQTCTTGANVITTTNEYNHNSEGKPIKLVSILNNNPANTTTVVYAYDTCGNMVKTITQNANAPNVTITVVYNITYVSECQMSSQHTIVNNKLESITYYKYNTNGKMTKQVYETTAPSPYNTRSVTTFTYDSYGNMTSFTSGNAVTTYFWKKL